MWSLVTAERQRSALFGGVKTIIAHDKACKLFVSILPCTIPH